MPLLHIKYYNNDNIETFSSYESFAVKFRELEKSKLLKKTVEYIKDMTPSITGIDVLYSYASRKRQLEEVLLWGEQLYKGYIIIEPTTSST